MPSAPAIIGGLSDPDLPANVLDREALGQLPVELLEQTDNLSSGPSLLHGSLPGTVYRGTLNSAGPVFGEQARSTHPHSPLPTPHFPLPTSHSPLELTHATTAADTHNPAARSRARCS